jgi:hypothetical protein
MLLDPQEVRRLIVAGERMLLAGEEDVLASLPAGDWIGGTTPYSMAESGGTVSREKVFATVVPPEIAFSRIETYDCATLPRVCVDTPEDGITFLILPASTEVHIEFARGAPEYERMYLRPLMGWIAGVHMDDQGRKSAKVFDGRTVSVHAYEGVALHGRLVPGKAAHIGIVNLFHQGDGEAISFPHTGFHVTECYVAGRRRDFASYLLENHVDTRLPLVDSYCGSNVGFRSVDRQRQVVELYAPVFSDTEYRIAAPVADYLASFHEAVPKGLRTDFSCNCLLNFLYSQLEGKVTKGVSGPVVFGEIAYQLLNQTLIYLSIEDASSPGARA